MAEPRTRTQRATGGEHPTARSTGTMLGVVLGVVAALASVVPGLFWLAWLLGAVAIALAVPTVRRGKADSGYGAARIAVGAGVFALVVGLINLGISADLFTYFTTEDAVGRVAR